MPIILVAISNMPKHIYVDDMIGFVKGMLRVCDPYSKPYLKAILVLLKHLPKNVD